MNSAKIDKDFNYAIQLTRLLLLPIGLWPTKSKFYQRIGRPLAYLFCIFIMVFVILPLILFIIIVVQDVKLRLKLIGPLSFGFMTMFKYVVMIYKKRQVYECFYNISSDWQQLRNSNERKIMMGKAKTARLLIIACILFMYGGGMPYITVLPLSKGPTQRGNQSLWPLSYPGYFVFFNPQVRPTYDIIFVLHCMCGMVRYTVTCGVYSIAILCVMHICSQITIIHEMLSQLVQNFDYKLLGEIVRQHLRLLKFASKLEEIFNEICLFEVFGSTCIICLLGFYLITEYESRDTIALITYFLLMVSFVFNIFILCYVGEILTEQCASIGKAAYMIEWYNLPQEEAKNMILLIIIAQRRVYLTAGKIVNLSILSFSSVIKASASYLNLLRTLIANSTSQ